MQPPLLACNPSGLLAASSQARRTPPPPARRGQRGRRQGCAARSPSAGVPVTACLATGSR
eukprot:scaffold71509_cov63-Phaeocystis_antarctica.AAC.1